MRAKLNLVSAAEAARLIGVSVTMVYRMEDLEPAHPKPRLYLLEDVQKIAAQYKPAGKLGAQRRRSEV